MGQSASRSTGADFAQYSKIVPTGLSGHIRAIRDAQMTAEMRGHGSRRTAGRRRSRPERLVERLEELGESTSTVKDVGAILGAFGSGLQEMVRADKPGKNARDGFVTENLEIAAYELLERLAQRAGDEETAQVARQNREEEEAMRDFFASSWDRVIDLTLEEEGVPVE